MFPSPHPGIINFFQWAQEFPDWWNSFRPLIRGLSISSKCKVIHTDPRLGFRPLIRGLSISSRRFLNAPRNTLSFRPLIRGLSISSHRHHYIFSTKTDKFAICKPRAPPEFSKKFHLPAAANCLILRAKTTKHGLLA